MIFAQATPDISAVPADFIKYTVILVGFAVVIGLQIYNAFFRGPQKREISGRVVNETVPEFADADDVEGLRQSVDQDKSVIAGRISEMQRSFADNLNALGKEIMAGMGELKVMTARHDAMIQQTERRITMLETAHNDSVTRLHARIDDAMKRK